MLLQVGVVLSVVACCPIYCGKVIQMALTLCCTAQFHTQSGKTTLYGTKADQEPAGYDWGMTIASNPYNGEVTVIPYLLRL